MHIIGPYWTAVGRSKGSDTMDGFEITSYPVIDACILVPLRLVQPQLRSASAILELLWFQLQRPVSIIKIESVRISPVARHRMS